MNCENCNRFIKEKCIIPFDNTVNSLNCIYEKIINYTCNKCGHKWEKQPSKQCPKCKGDKIKKVNTLT